jgi:hypothetical protein
MFGKLEGPALALIFLLFVAGATYFFGTCYGEHRDLGLSVISSVQACS